MNLYPNVLVNSVTEITIEMLRKNNIKALMLDVDNTLVDYTKIINDDIIKWAKNLKGQGIKIYILSNTNDEKKLKYVGEKLGIPYEKFAMKPLKIGFRKVQKELKEDFEKIGMVGDQIFTDVLGGNRCKMFTILVEPINEKDYWYTQWKRPLEEKIKRQYLNSNSEGENNNVFK